MRLTSYNMAVKVLHAKNCLADMVDRMWAYMEEGDTENAQCVREKALALSALIKTASRWRPTIKDGFAAVSIFDYSNTTTSTPYYLSFQRMNGMAVNQPFLSFGGTQSFVTGLVCASGHFISDSDDKIQFSAEKLSSLSLRASVTSAQQITSLGSDGAIGTQTGSPVITQVSSEEISDVQPRCLTNAQALSVVGKIDELCKCEC
jgi:hypothetical protein